MFKVLLSFISSIFDILFNCNGLFLFNNLLLFVFEFILLDILFLSNLLSVKLFDKLLTSVKLLLLFLVMLDSLIVIVLFIMLIASSSSLSLYFLIFEIKQETYFNFLIHNYLLIL